MTQVREAAEDDDMTAPPRPEKVPTQPSRRNTHDNLMDTTNRLQKHHSENNNPFKKAATSQDDMDVLRRPSDKVSEGTELRLYRQIEELREQLRAEQQKTKAAEQQRTGDDESMKSGFEELVNNNELLVKTVDKLEKESKRLKEELEDARTHIFALQPYRKDLTPEEVGRDYDDLVNSVSDWVDKLMSPALDDEDAPAELTRIARKSPGEISWLKRNMQKHGDLVQGSMFAETDIDIGIAIIMRYLYDNIFQKILYDTVSSQVNVLTFVEGSMQTNVEPKRDLFAIRTWSAEAYNAILCSPQFRQERERRMRNLTLELAGGFRVFHRDDDWNSFCVNFQDSCIKPAMKLYEKLLVSTHHFYLDINPYIILSNGQLEQSIQFLDELPNLACENILQARKKFNLAKLDPKPTKKDLYENLTNVVTTVPALYMRQVGRGDTIREPTIVRKQQMLVAWGPPEKKEKFMHNDEGLMNIILFTRTKDREKERGVEASVWQAPWKLG